MTTGRAWKALIWTGDLTPWIALWSLYAHLMITDPPPGDRSLFWGVAAAGAAGHLLASLAMYRAARTEPPGQMGDLHQTITLCGIMLVMLVPVLPVTAALRLEDDVATALVLTAVGVMTTGVGALMSTVPLTAGGSEPRGGGPDLDGGDFGGCGSGGD